MPIAAQGASFTVSNTANPATVRITGYGVDGPPPKFGKAKACLGTRTTRPSRSTPAG